MKKKVEEMPAEIDFSGGVRGKYASQYAKGTNVVALDPDVHEIFQDSEAVNAALRVVIRASARAAGRQPIRRSKAS